jgi:hypothetical protein
MNVLFVCSANRLRSPTAEQVFSTWPGGETDSAGISSIPRAALIRVPRVASHRGPSILRAERAQIVRQIGGIAARALSQRLVAQQHAGLGLVIGSRVVRRL